ncbi:NYN domain-containing protein [Altererythrobacter epoxidivorans]|uniref:NYN domain-containing protein n=1 Tax=Altererythrobacter epoxidivorans TaxID=361183 RepID=UPI003B82ECB1
MARLALRDLVRAVVVVTGDSDFVPAFKFVRREGVKVMLCALGHASARRELKAHADFVLS